MPTNVNSIFNAVFDNDDLMEKIMRAGQPHAMLSIMGRLNRTTMKVWIKIEEELHLSLARRRQHFPVLLQVARWLGTTFIPYGSDLTALSLASSIGHMIDAIGPLILALWPGRGVSSTVGLRGETLLAYTWYAWNGGTGEALLRGDAPRIPD